MQTLALVEPETTFAQRHAVTHDNAFGFTQTDAHMINLLHSGPQRITTVLNVTARLLTARSKRHRQALKRQTLVHIGTLIRQGSLRRIGRKFVALPM